VGARRIARFGISRSRIRSTLTAPIIPIGLQSVIRFPRRTPRRPTGSAGPLKLFGLNRHISNVFGYSGLDRIFKVGTAHRLRD
jgi:hypothetical protein